ncbi:MAG TPA: metallophosphoesterase [Solirubrobacteraceae bacterium]|nr:metallophosphoesterase [Solirubrobacteraceae bacterium]
MIAQLSDPHVRLPEEHGSADALARAVGAVLELEPLPDAVLVTGDLAEHANGAEYARVRELLEPLTMPVHVLPGNHDDPVAMREHFPLVGDGPYRYAVTCGDLRLVACDTTLARRDDGELDLEWLAAQLADDAPTIVAMHHPPLLTGIGGLDAIGLPAAQRAALADLLARSPHVRRVVAGHVHRGAFGMLGGCGVVACPSTNLQTRLEVRDEGFEIGDDPSAFVVHLMVGDELVSHVQPI